MSVKRIAALKNPSASLIFLHGLGDTGDGWADLAREIQRHDNFQHINIVLPTAPTQFVSGFQQRSTSWFDLKGLGSNLCLGNDGFRDSVATVKGLINKEIEAGIPAERIVLGGFSQGAALTLGSAIDLDIKLAGFMAHSGFLSGEIEGQEGNTRPVNVDSPVLVIHGRSDDVVDFDICGQPAYKALIDKYGFTHVTWKAYDDLCHTADRQTVQDMLDFLQANIPPK